MQGKANGRWGLLLAVLLAAILVPFFLFGSAIETWTETFLAAAGRNRGAVAGVLGGLLASDILLPIPSSIVSTACGMLLGFRNGLLTSSAGMTVSCVAGFYLARGVGRRWVASAVGEGEVARLDLLTRRFGDWALILARPVPVLAEVSVLLTGAGAMAPGRFLLLTTLSNVGISAAYAAIGSLAANAHSFLLAVGGSVLLPWGVMALYRRRENRGTRDRHAGREEEEQHDDY